MPSITIDGYGPLEVSRPESVAELCDLIQQSISNRDAIYPVGGCTALDLGNPPNRPGRAIDLRALDRVVDYPARDMTVTVQAGMILRELQSLLATENQRLPVDFSSPNERTVGGVLATNASGPRRYAFGSLRDHVIGMSFVNGEGREAKAGGRVVKNVAGYDLCKLHIGALGTLGIITQVTFRVRPLPEEKAVIVVRCERGRLSELLDLVHHTSTRPTCIELLNSNAAERIGSVPIDSAWVLVIGFEDNRAAIGWQVQQMVRELTPSYAAGLEARVGNASHMLWTTLTEGVPNGSVLEVKANVLPSGIADFCERVSQLPLPSSLQAHAGNGIVKLRFDRIELEQAREMMGCLLDWSGADGNVVVGRCPATWKTTLPVWGKPPADGGLMQGVKQALDPHDVFNPGRFVGSI
jgi:glycolate oxidase FAD binding subunit